MVHGPGEGDLEALPHLGVELAAGWIVVTLGELEGGDGGKVGADEIEGGIGPKGGGVRPYEGVKGHTPGRGAGLVFDFLFLGACVKDGAGGGRGCPDVTRGVGTGDGGVGEKGGWMHVWGDGEQVCVAFVGGGGGDVLI